MQTILYFVRHGRTPDKQKKHGQDESLSKAGFQQATKVAEYLSKIKPNLIYSGTYRRAEEMAQTFKNIYYQENYQVTKDPILNEISRPLVDGKPYTDINLKKYFLWRRDVIHSPNDENIRSRFMDSGESYWQFHQRCGLILRAFTNPQFTGKKIAVFTHSQVIETTKTWIRHGTSPTPHQLMGPFSDKDNFPPFGSISSFVHDTETNYWTILKSNYVDHLI